MNPDMIALIHLVLIVAATLAATLFCVLYAVLTRGAWMRTRHGRHLMALTFALAALGWNTITGEYPGDDIVEVGIYGLLTWQLVRRDVLLIDDQRRGRVPIAPVADVAHSKRSPSRHR